jgi:Trypsin-like peptidase domain
VFVPPSSRIRSFGAEGALVALSLLLAVGCVQPGDEMTGSATEEVVYGPDDREDVFAFANQAWAAQAANFSAAMVPLSGIDQTDPANVVLPAPTLTEIGICPDERFADQPVAGFCSGTLIGPDLILTAGHCISEADCADFGFVFNYYMTDETTLQTITSDDVYACEEVLVNLVDASDYAVVRLDREVVGRTPARVNTQAVALPERRRLVINGYPSGLPLKIDDGARVRDPRSGPLDFFVANLDTFGGNSGSGVFDNATKRLIGILVRGAPDYVDDPAGCLRVNRCPNTGCSGEDSTYAFRAVEALCATGAPAPGLCPCGDGVCDAEGGESTATCPFDCGTECGDGTCNGEESPNDCTEDCGTCGNGVCDGDDSVENCCTDCGCDAEGDVCLENQCVPDPFPGDTCELPLEIPVMATQTIQGDTLFAQNDFAGSCVGASAPDRTYTFTLGSAASFEALASGFDTGLYLRTACDDEASELACNDDNDPPGNFGSRIATELQPGTYFLVVDGFGSDSLGPYTLDVSFTLNCKDADGDFVCDADDGCPDDPDTTEPGACGCGMAETDGDEDGTPDCVDECAEDPAKTEPGECGCGVAETDTDKDGVPDCADACPEDAADECAGRPDDEDPVDPPDSDDGDDGASGGDDDDDDDDGGCNTGGGDTGGGPGGLLVSVWLLGMGAFGLRRRTRTSKARD